MGLVERRFGDATSSRDPHLDHPFGNACQDSVLWVDTVRDPKSCPDRTRTDRHRLETVSLVSAGILGTVSEILRKFNEYTLERFDTGGKPSTKFPPGELVEHATKRRRIARWKGRGPSFASNVSLENQLTLPPGVFLDSTEASAGTNTESSAESVAWIVGDLPVGTTSLLRLRLTVDASAEAGEDLITNLASVTSVDQTDVNPHNKTVSPSTSVERETDNTISIT